MPIEEPVAVKEKVQKRLAHLSVLIGRTDGADPRQARKKRTLGEGHKRFGPEGVWGRGRD